MNKKAFIFYFLTILILATSVFFKQKTIIKKTNREAITYYSDWKTEGKPVLVRKVQKTDIEKTLKITLIPEDANTYIGYLPKAFLKGLSSKSPIWICSNGQKILCKILKIEDTRDLESGMYLVKVYCPDKLSPQKHFAAIASSELKNVLLLPHGSINLDPANNRSFVWTIKDGKAFKQFISLEDRNSRGIIATGIDEKELIIVEGFELLQENDRVKINYGN
jgi:hypothetical protein